MNLFRRPSVRYGTTPQSETPYQRAAQVWDERIGSARVQAKNWRLMAFGARFAVMGSLLPDQSFGDVRQLPSQIARPRNHPVF